MNIDENIYKIVLDSLSGKKISDEIGLNEVYSQLLQKYNDKSLLNKVLSKLDLNHEGLLNCTFKEDVLGDITWSTPLGHNEFWLTSKGQKLANKLL